MMTMMMSSLDRRVGAVGGLLKGDLVGEGGWEAAFWMCELVRGGMVGGMEYRWWWFGLDWLDD